MFDENDLRMEVYVDDPGIVLRGHEQEVRKNAAVLLWWWCALGLTISWKKASLGRAAKWIGANFDFSVPGQVSVSIPAAYGEEVEKTSREILACSSVAVNVIKFAGG